MVSIAQILEKFQILLTIYFEMIFGWYYLLHLTENEINETDTEFKPNLNQITIDDLKELLRDGFHRLGDTSGILVWQAAEPDITATYGEPLSQKGCSTETWATIRFTVTQMIRA